MLKLRDGNRAFGLGVVVAALCGCGSSELDAPVALQSGEPSPQAVALAPTVAPTQMPAPTAAPPMQAPPPLVAAQVPVAQSPAQPVQAAPVQSSSGAGQGSLSQIIRDISAQIRQASSSEEANKHVFAAQVMTAKLNEKMRENPADANAYARWSSAIGHLAAAAELKSASFRSWGGADSQSKLMRMEVELNAAQDDAVMVERMVEARNNPGLAQQQRREDFQRRDSFQQRADFYERSQRPVDSHGY